MDFNDSPQQAAFRTQVRAWLTAHAKLARAADRAALETLPDTEALARARAWQATKAAAGYAAITWPVEYGGLGGTPIERVIYEQEETHYAVPRHGFFGIGLGMALPTLMTYGSPEQCSRYTRPALYGEEIWCQLFSEPAAGSDLAALTTRADRDGENWIINGQKVWTSYAQYADLAILLARSNPAKPKHAGLTFFFIDMKAVGVEVRPIKQPTGNREFNEVFLTDVRVPDAQRLGEVDEGWKVALTTLMFERTASSARAFGAPDALEVLELARRTELCGQPAIRDARVRERIAQWWINSRGLELTTYRALTELSRGQIPGPEFSIGKLICASQQQQVTSFMLDLLGLESLVSPQHELTTSDLHFHWLFGAAMRIAAGTDEIMKNILAERVLGLPAEVRVDKNIPFNQLQR
jgi:acyl-CoA dehydrogenase